MSIFDVRIVEIFNLYYAHSSRMIIFIALKRRAKNLKALDTLSPRIQSMQCFEDFLMNFNQESRMGLPRCGFNFSPQDRTIEFEIALVLNDLEI